MFGTGTRSLVAACALFIGLAQALAAPADPTLADLDAADREILLGVRHDLSRWSTDREHMADIRARIDGLKVRYPKAYAVRLIDSERQLFEYSSALGFRKGGMSYIPVFLDLHREAPGDARPLYMAAIGYIHTGDYAGGKPWLDKAATLAPDDPWVDLAQALWHGNQLLRPDAVAAAHKALRKSKGDALAMAVAVQRIAHHGGIADQATVTAIVDTMLEVEPDVAILTDALGLLIERYTSNQGQLAAAFDLAGRLDRSPNHDAELKLQLVRTAAFVRDRTGDPEGAAAFDGRLTELVEIESVAERARTLQLNIALGDGDIERAKALVEQGKTAKMRRPWVGWALGAVYKAQRMHKKVVETYEEYDLPADDTSMESRAMTGGREEAKLYHAQMVENEPTNPLRLADYAGFLFHFFGDYEQTIYHGSKAYEMLPDPLLGQRLASAYLARAAHLLEFGNESDARAAYRQAVAYRLDKTYVQQICYPLCEEIGLALDEFRETDL
jgi:tetratricopeptide (TPR) repeat protein